MILIYLIILILIILIIIILIIINLIIINQKKNIQKLKISKHNDNTQTIFVGIASYRDPELVMTLNDLIIKANKSYRIYIGVYQQNRLNFKRDRKCFAENSIIPTDHLRIKTVSYKLSKGPTFARSEVEKLWNNEDFYLQIDSHMRFEKDWDNELINMLMKCPYPQKTVISIYPEGYNRKNGKPIIEKKYRIERFKKFNNDGIVLFEGLSTDDKIPSIPQFVPFWSANFSFSSSNILKEIPYHPYTPFLFFGEEIFMTARIYTHGWELRGPTYSVIYHLWNRNYRHTFWEKNNVNLKNYSVQLVKDYITGKRNDLIFNNIKVIGNNKSLNDFWNYLHLDPINLHSLY